MSVPEYAEAQAAHLMYSWGRQSGYSPTPVESAEGAWIHTADGRKIFDLRSAHECINIGFRHPAVMEAMRLQMESVVYVTDDFATAPTGALAKKLASIAPGGPNKRVWFGQSGAAAVEAALKGAKLFRFLQVPAEPGIRQLLHQDRGTIAFENCQHADMQSMLPPMGQHHILLRHLANLLP